MRIRTAAAALLIVLGGWASMGASCGGQSGTPDTGSATTTAPGADNTAPAETSFDVFLAILAENGWTFTEDEKLIGNTGGVATYVKGCYIRVALIEPAGRDYKVTSVNGFGADYFNDDAFTKAAETPNITHSDFEKVLGDALAKEIVPTCRKDDK